MLPLLLTTPVFAGTSYVPLTGDILVGGQLYQTEILVSNNFPDILAVAETYPIASFQDGTVRAEEDTPTENWMLPGETRVLTRGGARGMLEVEASSEVYIQARLVGQGPAAGKVVEIPVVSSTNAVPANTTVQLMGLERLGDGAISYTNFGIVNLGQEATNCLVDIYRENGEAVLTDVVLTLNPLSHNQFNNVLRLLGETNETNMRFGVACDQASFPYAVANYPGSGEIAFIQSGASGKSELQRPLTGVSNQFDYISDLPVVGFGGIEVGPFLDRSGAEFHGTPGGIPVGGFKPIEINGVEYAKGVSWYPLWGRVPYMEFQLNGDYAVFSSVVRIDDHYFNHYEWAVVEENTGRWIRLERPGDGFRGAERTNPIRIGAAANFRILGDGEVLYQSGEIYAYGEGEFVEIDVRGVNVLRLQLNPDGTEQLGAPHRNGLRRARLVTRCSWHDMISFGDAKVYRAR
ncbi:MAG: NPCBM/NEW2 domain-containing protein [Acidobacteriota bacterium]